MKQFNLEEYLKNPSRKLVTRDGRKARIICTDMQCRYYPICALIDNDGEERYLSYSINGEFIIGQEDILDLFFSTEKKEGWINIYNGYSNERIPISSIYESEEDAKKALPNWRNRITTIKIEWEE